MVKSGARKGKQLEAVTALRTPLPVVPRMRVPAPIQIELTLDEGPRTLPQAVHPPTEETERGVAEIDFFIA